MGRRSEPWHWAERNGWYSTIRGKRKLLVRGGEEAKEAAWRELHRLLSLEPEAPAPPSADREEPTVGEIINRFHDYATDHLKPATMELYRRRLREFRAGRADMAAADLRPHHVNDWLASKAWGPSTRRTAIIIIRRAFSWAARQGHIGADPTRGVEKPRETRREIVPSAEAIQAIRAKILKPAFRDFFDVIAETGCRPGEAARVEARHIDFQAGTWTIEGKTTRKTGRMRVVYLNGRASAICRRLAGLHPEGPIFRNTRGQPWTIHAYGKQLRLTRKRAELGPEVVIYALRHAWITDALERGVPIATVAELAGHSSTAMIARVYSHLSDRASHLRDAVRKIRPDD